VLQRVAACCSVLQYLRAGLAIIVHLDVLHCMCCSYVAVCCSALQCAAVCCSVLQCSAVCCSMCALNVPSLCVQIDVLNGHLLQLCCSCVVVMFQCVPVCSSVCQCVPVCCSVIAVIV